MQAAESGTPGGEGAAGRLVAIGAAVEGGAPMRALDRAELREGEGVAGDRYATGRGFWTGRGDDPVTLIAAEEVGAAARHLGVELQPLQLRRNLVTRGIDLNALVGRTFRVGGVRLEGLRPCDPCRYLEATLSLPGLKDALLGRGGLRARVVRGGTVALGDRVEATEG